MSKKHFIKLAAMLKASKPVPQNDGHDDARCNQWGADVRAVADTCASFNGNFDRARFLSACGLQ